MPVQTGRRVQGAGNHRGAREGQIARLAVGSVMLLCLWHVPEPASVSACKCDLTDAADICMRVLGPPVEQDHMQSCLMLCIDVAWVKRSRLW